MLLLTCALCAMVLSACSTAGRTASPPPDPTAASHPRVQLTPLQAWMAHTPMYIAHRGGDGDWPEGTAVAYALAAQWNPDLALEVPVWQTADGVWVVSEDRTTGRVFDADYAIPATTWAVLSTLRTREGGHRMLRLKEDVLDVYGRTRILFVDDKPDTDAAGFLDLLDAYGGSSRFVVKSYWGARNVPLAADQRGYLTWGYYYSKDMGEFASTQAQFAMFGMEYDAPESDYATMRDTGKVVIAHLIATRQQAEIARRKGATGFMVTDVKAVVPREPRD